MGWFQIGKVVHQDCILSPYLFNYMQTASCEMPGWMKHKLELRLPGENINNLKYADDTTRRAESEKELKMK